MEPITSRWKLIEGVDLAKLVKETGPLPVDQACDYIRQAALGLQHAHEQGLVHRDNQAGQSSRHAHARQSAIQRPHTPARQS